MPPPGPLDEDGFRALLDDARRSPDPVERMKALRSLIGAARFSREDDDRHRAAVEGLEDTATHDLNDVLRETARNGLAENASPGAFEAWMRVVRPEEPALFDDSLRMAQRLSDDAYATAIPGPGDPLEEHARRALRLLDAVRRAERKVGDGDRILQSKAALLRLAERAVLQARDPATEQEARRTLELLRTGC